MSPRAAWRLEEAGFGPVYDYAAGKADWLAADLPFEGTAQLAGMFTRREVATAAEDTPAADALRRLDDAGFGPVLVLNAAGVVMGAAHREQLESAGPGTAAGALMRFGVSTVRPSEQVADLVHRMGHAEISRVVVTRSDGTLVGLFFAEDVVEVADDAGPADAGPADAGPADASPQDASPQDASPQDASPQDGSPPDVSSPGPPTP
jgi:CBS domain-containing protein